MSAALHVGVVVVALVGLPNWSRPRPSPPPPIAIEFVKIAEETRVVAPKAEEEQQQTEVKQEQTFAAAAPTPSAPVDAVPLPDKTPPKKAEPTPPKPQPKPKPQISANRQLANTITPRAKPRPPSRLRNVSALIDRAIKEEREKAPEAEEKKEEAKKAEEPKKQPDLLRSLRGTVATASLMDALRRKVEENWSFPGGAKGIEKMQVTIRIHIRPDGSFSRAPEFLNAGNLNDPDRAFFRIFAESARRAVLLSEPFDEAAQHLDASQKYIDFNFNGAEFAGG